MDKLLLPYHFFSIKSGLRRLIRFFRRAVALAREHDAHEHECGTGEMREAEALVQTDDADDGSKHRLQREQDADAFSGSIFLSDDLSDKAESGADQSEIEDCEPAHATVRQSGDLGTE